MKLILAQLVPMAAWGHGGADSLQKAWWTQWNWDWAILPSLVALSILYFLGRTRLRQKKESDYLKAHAICFYLGVFALFLALISPIDPLSDVLGSIHMLQHTLIMMIAAPLMVLGAPGYIALWSIPSQSWKRWGRLRRLTQQISQLPKLVRPLVAWVLYSLTLWIWHIPLLYEGALKKPLVHDLQHLAFFGTSFLFWGALFDPFSRNKLNPVTGIIYVFVASIHSMILGVLMALSPKAWYEPYTHTAPHFGLTALEDQQIAGLIMWMPAGITYLIVAGYLTYKLVSSGESKNLVSTGTS